PGIHLHRSASGAGHEVQRRGGGPQQLLEVREPDSGQVPVVVSSTEFELDASIGALGLEILYYSYGNSSFDAQTSGAHDNRGAPARGCRRRTSPLLLHTDPPADPSTRRAARRNRRRPTASRHRPSAPATPRRA